MSKFIGSKDIKQNSDTILKGPPKHPPILIRRNASWDANSMEKEKKRVDKIFKMLGISENFHHGQDL